MFRFAEEGIWSESILQFREVYRKEQLWFCCKIVLCAFAEGEGDTERFRKTERLVDKQKSKLEDIPLWQTSRFVLRMI